MRLFIFIFLFFTKIGFSNSLVPEINISPETIVLYIDKASSIQTFTLDLTAPKLVENVKIFINFSLIDGEEPQFYTNNIKWENQKNVFYLTGIYNRPALIHIFDKTLHLQVAARVYSEAVGTLQVVKGKNVIKEIPLKVIAKPEISAGIIDYLKKEKEITGGIIAAFVFIWFIFEFIRRRKKEVPLCSTRGRFSTTLEQEHTILIEEINNPFGCRLGGLKKGVTINYSSDTIYLMISGAKKEISDRSPAEFEINPQWKIRLESQKFLSKEGEKKSLVILLLPA